MTRCLLAVGLWLTVLAAAVAAEVPVVEVPRGEVTLDGAPGEAAYGDGLTIVDNRLELKPVQDGPVLVLALLQHERSAFLKTTFRLTCPAGVATIDIAPEDLAFPLVTTRLEPNAPAAADPDEAGQPGLPILPAIIRPTVRADLAMQLDDGRRRIELAVDLAGTFAQQPAGRIGLEVTTWMVDRLPTPRGAKHVYKAALQLNAEAGEAGGTYRWTRLDRLRRRDDRTREAFDRARALLVEGDPPSRARAVRLLREASGQSLRRVMAARLAADTWSDLAERAGGRATTPTMLEPLLEMGLADVELVDDMVKHLADLGRFDEAATLWRRLPEDHRRQTVQQLRLARLQMGGMKLEAARATWGALLEQAPPLPDTQRRAVTRQLETMNRFIDRAEAELKRRATDGGTRRVLLHLAEGPRKRTLELELFERDAPKTVANFIDLARKDFFDGQRLYGLEPGVLIRGGDPNTATRDTGLVGKGGPGHTLEREASGRVALRGAVVMDVEKGRSAGSRFVLTVTPMPDLDKTNTVFGRVVKGLEHVGELSEATRIVDVEVPEP
ncbi:MAG: peptidylprolyl isomerase [Planctomycetota bacterium]